VTTVAAPQRFREFKMPDVGEGLTEAEILKWYVKPGDTVTDGQVVCEVETAKAAVELPIPFDGVVHELRFPEGETVDVGTVIISVDTGVGDGGEPAAPAATEPAAAQAPAAEPEQKRQPVLVGYGVAVSSTKRRARKKSAVPAQSGAQQAVQGELNGHAPAPAPVPVAAASAAFAPAEVRPLAKPPVRKLAKDLGVDLASVTPTGPEGTITREDVQKAAAPAAVPAAPAQAPVAPQPAAVPAVAAPLETRVPIKGVRKATAAAMVASAFTAPHVTEFVTFDITRTMRLVQELKADPAFGGLKVSPLLLVAKAVLVAIRRNPEINAAWDEANQEIVHKGHVNLGIAAATPRGLIVPNVKDAQTWSPRPARAGHPRPTCRAARSPSPTSASSASTRARPSSTPGSPRSSPSARSRRCPGSTRAGSSPARSPRSRSPSTTAWSTASSAPSSSPTSRRSWSTPSA
jgi:2-oxoisovalerate dehydrogenase E2 component (dihydrolipoyl transacylase)